MKKLVLKNKKRFFVMLLSILLVLAVGGTICAVSISNNKKSVETVGQAIEENENTEEPNETDETNTISNNIEEPKNNEIVNESGKTNNNTNNTANSKYKYYIKVNNTCNVVTIYTKDSDGNYTVPFKAMVCSTGTATPVSGKYKLNGTRYKFHTLFGHTPGTYVYGQYAVNIDGKNILFHSVPYTVKGDPSSLEYWEYDKLGTRASAGCIRLTVADAKWIYDNIASGTTVEFYNDSNPGPLGKPSARKISGNAECRGWDPTDPNPSNPWKNSKPANPQPATPQPSPVEQQPIEEKKKEETTIKNPIDDGEKETKQDNN